MSNTTRCVRCWFSHECAFSLLFINQVSTEFILSCLGPYAKYSSCLYPTGKETLEEAEILMLESYCEKAQLRDGLDILDLGCGTLLLACRVTEPCFNSYRTGWGSLSLYLAQVSRLKVTTDGKI
jgi:hypothetical protein